MLISETKFVVRYAETDQMGIVHHSNYPIWFEAGRTDFIKKLGVPYSSVENEGFMFPLIELNCKYLSSARYEDEITVITSIKKNTGTRAVFYYEVYKEGVKKPIATGETVHVWTNKELRPVNIKKCKPELFELMENGEENL